MEPGDLRQTGGARGGSHPPEAPAQLLLLLLQLVHVLFYLRPFLLAVREGARRASHAVPLGEEHAGLHRLEHQGARLQVRGVVRELAAHALHAVAGQVVLAGHLGLPGADHGLQVGAADRFGPRLAALGRLVGGVRRLPRDLLHRRAPLLRHALGYGLGLLLLDDSHGRRSPRRPLCRLLRSLGDHGNLQGVCVGAGAEGGR
mmetsp:Transcript_37488/g.111940  ORF Transcript_37488/g.111940 Transcript_37488/m.111940 type:complete len:202 (-) Transcript_37488:775-1380(-)